MVYIGLNEAALFFFGWVILGVAGVRRSRVMIIITPFGKVVRELETRSVSGGVLEVNYDQLLVGVRWEQQRGFARWLEAENIPVLGLQNISSKIPSSET